ncbi:MAG: sigma-70 family RNA polymerase sigma factor [Pyrinomonadaceae bacterium]
MTQAEATKSIENEHSPLSFDDAFVLHHRVVYRTVYHLVRDVGLAEDITQEVFLKLHRHFDAAPRDEGLRPWLLRVGLNCARNTLRGRYRSHHREEAFVKHVHADGFAAAPDEDYEKQVQIEETRRSLDKVKEPMRSCLILQQQGLSYKEIAETLSLNSANVGSLIARGRKEFLRFYGKIGGAK